MRKKAKVIEKQKKLPAKMPGKRARAKKVNLCKMQAKEMRSIA